MALIWNGVPTFGEQGQVLSASAHLDALATATNQLYDRIVGVQMPFTGSALWGEGTVSYWLKHQSNSLYVNFSYKGRVIMNVNGVEVKRWETSLGDVAVNETVDISGRSLTAGQVYQLDFVLIEKDGPMTLCHLVTWSIYESISLTYPTLATFADDTTPTLQNWQDLATYATKLHQDTALPTQVIAGSYGEAVTTGPYPGDRGYGWHGSVIHRGGKLFLRVLTSRNVNKREGGPVGGIGYSCNFTVYINGQDAGYFTNEGQDQPGFRKTFEVYVQPELHGAVVGQEYTVRLAFVSCGPDAFMGARYEVKAVCEIPNASPSLTGYIPMADWTHGDYVYGSTGTKRVKTIRDNLLALAGARGAICYPTLQTREITDWGETWAPLMMARRHRFLKYRYWNKSADENNDGEPDEEAPQAELKWHSGKTLPNGTIVYNSATLETANNEWKTIDLSAQDGLWPGTQYYIYGVTWAFEDSDA